MDDPVYYLLSRKHHGRPNSPSARMRLVVYGFAGGTITSLLSLIAHLPAWIEVWGAEYPGRGLRWRDALSDETDLLLNDLAPGLEELADRPIALMGYSMGAQVAYHLARSVPIRLCGFIAVSACPPANSKHTKAWQQMNSSELLNHVRSLGGVPDAILASPVILDAFMRALRADLNCCREMATRAAGKLSCPALALRGIEDPIVTADAPAGWLDLASGFDVWSSWRAYPRGHFLHQGMEERVATDIADWLSTLPHREAAYADVRPLMTF